MRHLAKTLISLILIAGAAHAQGAFYEILASSNAAPACTLPTLTTAGAAYDNVQIAALGTSCAPGCTNGQTVTSWADQSPAGHNYTGGSVTYQTPGINGHDAVSLNGSQFMGLPGTTTLGAGSQTMLAIFKNSATTPEGVLYGQDIAVGALGWHTSESGKLQGLDQDFVAGLGTGNAATDTAWHYAIVNFSNGGGCTFTLDGVSDGTCSSTATITVGNRAIGNSPGGTFFTGSIERILHISGHTGFLNGTDITGLIGYGHCNSGI